MKKINLFFVILLLFVPFCFAYDQTPFFDGITWTTPNGDDHNTREAENLAYGYGNLINFQNISIDAVTTASYSRQPLFFDINQDGNRDILMIYSGMLNILIYNSTSGIFNTKLEYILPETDETSGILYNPYPTNSLYFVYASKSNLYFLNISSDVTIPNVFSVALTNQANNTNVINGEYALIYSPVCVYYSANKCMLKETGQNYEIFDISNMASITKTAYTNSSLNAATISATKSFTPTVFEYGTKISFAFPCRNATGYGIFTTYLNGSIINQNCGFSSREIFSNIMAKDITGGSTDEFVVASYDATNQDSYVLNSNTLAVLGSSTDSNANLVGKGNIFSENHVLSLIYWDAATKTYLFHFRDSILTFLYSWTLTGTVFQNNDMSASGISGQDWVDVNGYFRSILNNYTYYIYISNYVSPSYVDGAFILAQQEGSILRLSRKYLNQINAKIYFVNNATGQVIQTNVFGNLINSTTGQIRLGLPIKYSNYTLINFAENLQFNVTSDIGNENTSQFFPYNNRTNLYYGRNSNVFINLIPNSSATTSYDFAVYNANNGELVTDGYYNLYWLNSSSGYYQIIQQNKTLAENNENLNIPIGNYTLAINSLGLFDVYSKSFYLDVPKSEIIFLTPRGGNYGNIPRITESISYTYYFRRDLKNSNVQEVYEESPNQICLDQDIWVNFTALGLDPEKFNAKYNCGDYLELNPYEVKETFGIAANIFKGIANCIWNETGNKTIKIWVRSATFPYTLSDFDTLFNSGLAKKYTVQVNNCSKYIDVTEAPKSDDVVGGYMGSLGFQSYAAKRNISILILVIIFVGVLFGVIKWTGEAVPGLVASAIASSLGALFLFAVGFISPAFLLFILLICIVYGVITVIFSGNSTSG